MSVLAIICQILFWVSAFIIVWAMFGYKYSLKILGKIFVMRKPEKSYEFKPHVTILIVAHNEEKVILEKLNNAIMNDYPKDRIEYIVVSDASTDRTHEIVDGFISEHPETNIRMIIAQSHEGKTNAQNEAQKFATGEILVMSDANSMFEKNAISELVASFYSDEIAYVCGRLKYINSEDNDVAASESFYWEGDLTQREIESNIRTITAGNGAIYACRNSEYYDFDLIQNHDSNMPFYFARKGKRAIYNPDAVAYEKAGESIGDEFNRKVRMNRNIFRAIRDGFLVINIFRYGWFSYFYFGHRTCRYLLWLAHAVLLAISIILIPVYWLYLLAAVVQVVFYLTALVNYIAKGKIKWLNMVTYYSMTLLAQWKGVINCIMRKNEPIWESVESTR